MGLMRMAARTAVVAGTATAVSGRVARRQAARYDAKEQEQYDAQELAQYRQQGQQPSYQQAPPPQPAYQQAPPAAPAQDDSMAQLHKLADLHTAGLLSAEEFAAAKARILGI